MGISFKNALDKIAAEIDYNKSDSAANKVRNVVFTALNTKSREPQEPAGGLSLINQRFEKQTIEPIKKNPKISLGVIAAIAVVGYFVFKGKK